MKTQADRIQKEKSQSSSDGKFKSQSSGKSTFQFVDSRPEVIVQRKLQEIANNSPHAIQLRAFRDMANNSPQANKIAQLQTMVNNQSAQQKPIQKKENNTGLPDNLKTGVENLSGISLDDVKVHRNSDKPAQLQAHAYAQGTDIHLASGQEKHLPHEAWHVVQQKQGRVKPTMQMKYKTPVNDDIGLEKEADVMGAKAENITNTTQPSQLKDKGSHGIQSAQLLKATIKSKIFGNHGVYDEDFRKLGIIPGGSVIEVNPNDCYMMEDKTYVRITSSLDSIQFTGGGNLGDTDVLFVSDRAFSPVQDETKDQAEDGIELTAGEITYQNGKVTIPILGQDLEINKNGGSLSGALPSEKFEANLPNLSFDIDVPFGPAMYATAGLAITPSLAFEVSGGSYTIKAEEDEKSISIKDAKIEGSIGLEIKASAGVGVGAANIVGLDTGIFAAIDGKASLAGSLGGISNFTERSNNIDLGVKAAADIEGKAGAFIKAKLGPLSARKDFPVAKKTFAHFSYTRTLSLGSSQANILKPTLTDFTKKEFGNINSTTKYLTVAGKTYEELPEE
jgi:hypothetical protein